MSALGPEARYFFFDAHEEGLVRAGLAVLHEAGSEQEALVRDELERLARAAVLIRESPSILRTRPGKRRAGGGEALIDLLCKVPDYDLDLHIPTKAVLGQAYLVTKINFWKALGYALELIPDTEDLKERLGVELGQSIYSKLAEELFISIVTDADGHHEVKASAARSLFRIWDERLETEIDDFAPVLESIWHARHKVRPVLGTMLGTQETFALLREARDGSFLDYFGDDGVPVEQVQAFEEFLFGLSHEEIERLREHIGERSRRVVSTEEARGVLGRRMESWAPAEVGPQALYTSYKRRRVKAHYRSLTRAPGPKRTAEEYVMTELIRRSLFP
jgi:hypothetical protein